jgi:dTDP-6-deoxy-L-talose 4-dehydrogenase (NAD+)
MRRILITGATGFVGRQVLLQVAKLNLSVTLIVRGPKIESFREIPAVDTIIGTNDLFAETTAWWANAFQGIDTVIHLAWDVEPTKYLYSLKNIDCLQGTLAMAQGAVIAGVRRIIGIGTCFEYDLNYCSLSIETPLKPLTPYAGAKAAVFTALSNWLPSQSVEFVWCRLFYLYGEGEDVRRLVPNLRSKLAAGEKVELSSGTQIRDYLDVSVAGRLIADIAIGTVQGPINICSGIPITVKQLAEKIADEYGRRDLLNFSARKEDLFNPPIVLGVIS